MKTLAFHLPVLDPEDTATYLDLVTSVDGVVAALLDPDEARLDVVVSTEACALLVREQVVLALLSGWPAPRAA